MSLGASLGGMAGGMWGSIIGEIWASGDEKEAEKKMKEAQALIDGLQIPSVEKQKIKLQLAEFVELGPTAMANIKVDPMFEGIQKEALASYQQKASGVGTDKQAKAAQFQGMRAAGQAAAARQGAVRQDMRARGLRGSGLDMAAQQLAGQQEAETAAGLGFAAAADSEARRSQNQDKAAGLAGAMGDTSFNRQSAIAQAADRVSAQNAAGRNQNNQFNANTSNQEEVYNKELIGRNYERQVEKARLQAGARTDQVGFYQNKANRKRGIASSIGEFVGTGAGMAATGGA
jgi:hypothetical protein